MPDNTTTVQLEYYRVEKILITMSLKPKASTEQNNRTQKREKRPRDLH